MSETDYIDREERNMEPTEDEKAFGPDRWVYCKQHLRPHGTGWCTVEIEEKILLDAKSREEALTEARAKGLEIYGDVA